MKKYIIGTAIILVLAGLLGYFVYNTEKNESKFNFKYGLDLSSGAHLTYRADTRAVQSGDIPNAMESLRTVIEKRINVLSVSEPIVQTETTSGVVGVPQENRLTVELPGVTDLKEAIATIGKTPQLEFRLQDEKVLPPTATSTDAEIEAALQKMYVGTGLTGSDLKKATLIFDPQTRQPTVSLEFNDAGRDLFASLTEKNVGKVMAIFLDGKVLSAPVIQDKIANGQAVITGTFTAEEARNLVRDLNFGALPLPIELIGTQTVGSTLGENTLNSGMNALVVGFLIISLFMIVWYRLPGLVSVISLSIYVVIMMSLFKTIPVVLTAAGIAGFILSLGIAVDANVLIFERIKEELKDGKNTFDAVSEGVKRAWFSIRDGNLSSLISAAVLYWMSGAAVVKGFSLVFGLGVLVSMFTAIVLSRIILLAIASKEDGKVRKFLFSNGFNFKK